MKRILGKVYLGILIITFIVMSSVSVGAAGKVKMETHTYWEKDPSSYTVFMENFPKKGKIISIKSSNRKVLKAEKWSDDEFGTVVTPRKAGKCKITIKYKDGKKIKRVSGWFKVKKYPNAIKSLVYNNKKLNLKENPFESDFTNKKVSSKVNVKVKPNKGWNLVEMEVLKDAASYKNLQNGKSIKIALKGRLAVLVTLENKKGEEFEYFINLTSGD